MANQQQGAPRKFSEKIAIMQRKLDEDEDSFTKVMREVREITSGTGGGELQPGQWNGAGGGSLPNMHQSSTQPQASFWPEPSRGRSPGSHYHPYRAPRSQERVPPLHGPVTPFPVPPAQYPPGLIPPQAWNGVGRAHSAPSINMNPMSPVMSPFQHGMAPFQDPSMHSPAYSGSPVYNGSPAFNGSSSPINMIPRPEDGRGEMVGSLPNIPPSLNQPPGPSHYHQQVGQRHSTGGCGTRLAPSFTPESQSAPTSPAQITELGLAPAWPLQRHYSNSPESLDIPNIVLTEADGLDGGRLDCFDPIQMDQALESTMLFDMNMQDLRLDTNDMQMMCNGDPNNPQHNHVYR